MSRSALALSLSRQRWLPYKTRRSLIKRIYPRMLLDFSFEAPMEGGLVFSGNILNYIDRLIYFCGAHEKYMLHFLRDYLHQLAPQEKNLFIDIGANAGNHTLYMSRFVDEVHAFEPYPRVREQLEKNLVRNRISNVQVYPFGLSDQEATLPFYAAPDSNLGAASFFADHKQDNYYLGDMQLKRGDEVLKNVQGRVVALKADIEGYEKFALMGLSERLTHDRPLIIIEVSPKTRETLGSEAALRALFPPDYDLFYFVKGKLDSGAYRLAPYRYALTPKIQDVIACPAESLTALGQI